MGGMVHRRGPARIAANLTPMIDMTFLLIVFFVLVSQITDQQRVEMDLPRPLDPATLRTGDEQRTIVNVVPMPGVDDGSASMLRVAGLSFPPDPDGIAAFRAHLGRMYTETPGMRVDLRADRRVRYRFVAPVMRAITNAADDANVLPRVNLVVERDG